MAAVIGLLDILLCDEYMTSEQVAMVSQIRDCSTALLRLLNNILDLSKVRYLSKFGRCYFSLTFSFVRLRLKVIHEQLFRRAWQWKFQH